MGVLGAPLYPDGAIRSIYMYMSRLSMGMVGLTVLSVLTAYGESPYRAVPIRFFKKIVWGLPAATEDPQSQVVDNLPRYGS